MKLFLFLLIWATIFSAQAQAWPCPWASDYNECPYNALRPYINDNPLVPSQHNIIAAPPLVNNYNNFNVVNPSPPKVIYNPHVRH